MKVVYDETLTNPNANKDYKIWQGVLLFKGRIMIPNEQQFKLKIMEEFHSSKTSGHAGMTKTLAKITSQFFWPKMQQEIRTFVRECSICQQAKVDNVMPAGLLKPLPIPHQI